MSLKILQISPERTLEIRHKVMWPDKSIDYVKLPNDENGEHFGLFTDDKLISVVSLFIENDKAQFRKFATLGDDQGKGYGTILLQEVFRIVQEKGLKTIWCNARVSKINFYMKFGMLATPKRFDKGGIEYVIMEKELL